MFERRARERTSKLVFGKSFYCSTRRSSLNWENKAACRSKGKIKNRK